MASARTKILKKVLKESYPIEKFTVDLSNDPVVVAKREKAEKFIAEHGLPESSNNKSRAKKTKKV
jgi:hypothetical protein